MAQSFLRWFSCRPATSNLDALTLLVYNWAFDDGLSKIQLDTAGGGFIVTSASGHQRALPTVAVSSALSREGASSTSTPIQGTFTSCVQDASEEVATIIATGERQVAKATDSTGNLLHTATSRPWSAPHTPEVCGNRTTALLAAKQKLADLQRQPLQPLPPNMEFKIRAISSPCALLSAHLESSQQVPVQTLESADNDAPSLKDAEFLRLDSFSDIGSSGGSSDIDVSFPFSQPSSPHQGSLLHDIHDVAAPVYEDEGQLDDPFVCDQDDVDFSFSLQDEDDRQNDHTRSLSGSSCSVSPKTSPTSVPARKPESPNVNDIGEASDNLGSASFSHGAVEAQEDSSLSLSSRSNSSSGIALPLPALQQRLQETAETAAFGDMESSHSRNSFSLGTALSLPALQHSLPETAMTACFRGRDSQDQMTCGRDWSAYVPHTLPAAPDQWGQQLQPGDIVVSQLAAPFWQRQCLAVLREHKLTPGQVWVLRPSQIQSLEAQYFDLQLKNLSVVGGGGFGVVTYHQRWVGQGVPGSPEGGAFVAVAVKMVVLNADAERELQTLQQVQKALQGQAGPHHIIQLVECMDVSNTQTGLRGLLLVCKFADGFSPACAFQLLRERCEQGSDEMQQQALEDLLAAVAELLRQLLWGVGVLHDLGLVHGDVKSSNMKVSMRHDGSELHLVVVDLGSTISVGTCCEDITMTPVYAAPEVLGSFVNAAQASISKAADIWSIGCLVYDLLADCYLFPPSSDNNSTTQQTASSTHSAASACQISSLSAAPHAESLASSSCSMENDTSCAAGSNRASPTSAACLASTREDASDCSCSESQSSKCQCVLRDAQPAAVSADHDAHSCASVASSHESSDAAEFILESDHESSDGDEFVLDYGDELRDGDDFVLNSGDEASDSSSAASISSDDDDDDAAQMQHVMGQHRHWAGYYHDSQMPDPLISLEQSLSKSRRGRQVMDLLQHMLHPEPLARFTAQQIMAHDFLCCDI